MIEPILEKIRNVKKLNYYFDQLIYCNFLTTVSGKRSGVCRCCKVTTE